MLNSDVITKTADEFDRAGDEFEKLLDRKLFDLQQRYPLVRIAEFLGCKKTQAGLYINSGSLPARRIARLVMALIDDDIPTALARLKGRMLIDAPRPGAHLGAKRLADLFAHAGHLVEKAANADANGDGLISPAEAKPVIEELQRVIAVTYGYIEQLMGGGR